MHELIRAYPVKSLALKKELVGEDVCPDCGGNLDTGQYCMSCGANWADYQPVRLKKTQKVSESA